jgi:hypothetical protein
MIMKQWTTTSFVLDLPRGHWTVPVMVGCVSIGVTLVYYLLVYLKYWWARGEVQEYFAELDDQLDLFGIERYAEDV